MKTYQNPQPQAVESANKIRNKPSNLAGSKNKNGENLKKSNKEIFKNESEEQAWKDALKKDKSGS